MLQLAALTFDVLQLCFKLFDVLAQCLELFLILGGIISGLCRHYQGHQADEQQASQRPAYGRQKLGAHSGDWHRHTHETRRSQPGYSLRVIKLRPVISPG